MNEGMLNRWRALWSGLRVPEEKASAVFARIVGAYAEPHRRYHTLEHIEACLALLDQVSPNDLDNRLACEWAIWFHDFVYDPFASDNEQKSVAVSGRVIEQAGISRGFESYVTKLILGTRHVEEPKLDDERLVVEIDLSILGTESDVFDQYDRAIRYEYKAVPWDIYRERRAQILYKFLEQGQIFRTPTLRSNGYNERARLNLARAIEQLDAQPDSLLSQS